MKVGRNDPCPCGSGKKFKKCCQKKDKVPTTAKAEEVIGFPVRFDAFDEPSAAEEDVILEALTSGSVDEVCARFRKMIEEQSDSITGYVAFEAVNHLHCNMSDEEHVSVLVPLIVLLKEKLPVIFEHENIYLLAWWYEILIHNGKYEAAREPALAFARTSQRDMEGLLKLLQKLAYHDQLDLLSEVLQIAIPIASEIHGFFEVERLQKQLADFALRCELFRFWKLHPNGDPLSDECLGMLAYTGVEKSDVVAFLENMKVEEGREWTLEDFALPSPEQFKKMSAEERLSNEALRHFRALHMQFYESLKAEGRPAFLTFLAVEQLEAYLRDVYQANGPKRVAKKSKKKAPRTRPNKLCPDPRLFGTDIYEWNLLGGYYGFMLFERVPLWLHFLVKKGLLEEEERVDVYRKLKDKALSNVRQAAEKFSDPCIKQTLSTWD